MIIEPIAVFRSPLKEKFGIPRQSGVVPELRGEIHLNREFRPESLKGLDGFDYLWLIWEFSLNGDGDGSMTVRPPRLGGNERVGVFASRSPFRPNRLGLSSVKIESIDFDNGIIGVSGADLADLTPIYDIKPYVIYCDSHPGARSGFTAARDWERLEVRISGTAGSVLSPCSLETLVKVLEQDPRPAFHSDPDRVYGMSYEGHNVKFKVCGSVLEVTEIQ